MRPVTKGVQPPEYQPPTNLRFRSEAIAKVLKTTNPPLTRCLEKVWLVVAKVMANPPANYPDLVKAQEAIEKRVTEIYKQAAVPLMKRLADYCSYCETRLTGLLEVEHTVPKSQFPTFAVDWDNFLIACGPCNTAKGDGPSRTQLRAWIGVDLNDENQSYQELRQRWILWPDVDPHSSRRLPARLEYDPNSQKYLGDHSDKFGRLLAYRMWTHESDLPVTDVYVRLTGGGKTIFVDGTMLEPRLQIHGKKL
jgi:hypothetical protein